ncbi:MAG: hypothetical protein NC924_05770 [Candidatus Omnitrophica bacterium]|nr:hypothetical protein [Candidatus Omnitrophota bacterium]
MVQKKADRFRRLLFGISVFIGALGYLFGVQAADRPLYVIPVSDTIDLGLSAFIQRAIREATRAPAAAIILDINTLGGRIDAADEIVAALADCAPIPTIAYVSNTAWSAGALIALACDTILMKNGSSIGSAEPRSLGMVPGQESTDEKIISALRAKFKATAERHGHSPDLAQAMVDKDIELIQVTTDTSVQIYTRQALDAEKTRQALESIGSERIICPAGKLLNLTAEEAVDIGLARAVLADESGLRAYIGKTLSLAQSTLEAAIRPQPNWSENIVRFLTHPLVSSLLLSFGFLGIIFELKIPGWGISGTLGVVCLALFFWGHYLTGLTQWIDIVLVFIGAILLFIEFFITPGFGVLGGCGFLLLIAGLFMTLIKNPLPFPSLQWQNALAIISQAAIFSVLILAGVFKFFPKTALWKRIALTNREDTAHGYSAHPPTVAIAVGMKGKAATMLRPAGKAYFNGRLIDVTTDGDFIEPASAIEIVRSDGAAVVVKRTEA